MGNSGQASTDVGLGPPRAAAIEQGVGMPMPPHPLPESLGEGFACAQARCAGVSPRRLRAGDLERPFRGARLRREPETAASDAPDEPLELDRRIRRAILRRARAYAAVAPAGSFFIGPVALVAHDLPLRTGWEGAALTVAAYPPRHAPRARGIHGTKVSPRMVRTCVVDGLRVADPATAWALCADHLGDAIVRIPRDDRGRPRPAQQKATIEALRAAALVPWRRGRERLLAALELIRVGSMSPLETDFRLVTARAGLPEPELDVEIRDDAGRLIGIVDAVYREQRVIVEVEGRHHATSDRQWNRDLDKYAALAAAGWEVIRVTSRHIRGENPRVVALVAEALARRAVR